ncbi:hypothetical protein GGX14DRAFT_401153 [Mycena pura]|uniref:Uncharacterized protein n=1 Tax=Mycena pura TaxID=153505 RepID=A0AAD6V4Y3_9AGAR|nr:hypothetical protein GGX14DRAFT_401153 [Mycena pura]
MSSENWGDVWEARTNWIPQDLVLVKYKQDTIRAQAYPNIFNYPRTPTKYIFKHFFLHTAIRLVYFRGSQWDPVIAVRARKLLLNMVKKYADTEQTQAPADSVNTAVKAAQGPSLFAMAVVLQDSPTDLQVTKEWLKAGLAEGVNYTDFIKIKGAQNIFVFTSHNMI